MRNPQSRPDFRAKSAARVDELPSGWRAEVSHGLLPPGHRARRADSVGVQSQSSPSLMRRQTTQFGSSNSSKRNVASVHAPALASSSSAATLPTWRRDSSRVHPCRTLRNRRLDSAGADCNAASNSLKLICPRLCMANTRTGRRGTVPAKMASRSVKKPEGPTP